MIMIMILLLIIILYICIFYDYKTINNCDINNITKDKGVHKMEKLDLNYVKDHLSKITQGDWIIDPKGPSYSINVVNDHKIRHIAMVNCSVREEKDKSENIANANFIVASPMIIKTLIEHIEKLEKVVNIAESIKFSRTDEQNYLEFEL